ncbi:MULTISPECIES: trehalose operon repressor [unclassified Virgibacillus]|uniref:trehalose operon repressor n=1 Tax=unclassified Virgibacillus TaxID=2620237 RepID=UPI0024DE363F|nr:trehalose operon repressor [Virgibacillus sp. LDC-1]
MQRKYNEIYEDLVRRIQANEWQEDNMLPSENELSEMYRTSRETIRKALNLLVQNGYIQKIRGKGSVIIQSSMFDFPVSGIASFKELSQQMDLQATTDVHELSLITADEDVQRKLNVTPKAHVWKVVRVRNLASEKVILDKDYLDARYVPALTKSICEDSIYDYLEKELGLVISFAKKEIIVETPTKEDRALLDMDGFSNVVVIRSFVYLNDASLFQYTESRHRPDKFRFVDFARRGNQ